MVLDICNNSDVLSILRIIKIVIRLITIIVPIILIISLSINYLSAVKDKDNDGLAKANKNAIPKIIATILVFMIPTFVHILGNLTNETSFLHCLDIATKEHIGEVQRGEAIDYLEKVKKSLNINDYNAALSRIIKLKDEEYKQSLLDELQIIKEYVDIASEINKTTLNVGDETYNKLLEKINSIQDETYKKRLLELLDKKAGSQEDLGEPLNIASSFNKYNDNKYKSLSGYYLYIPKNARANMPLVVVFPPNSLSGESMKSIVSSKNLDNLQAFIYIPTIASSDKKDWNQTTSKDAVSKIKDLIKEYKLNENKISLTAFSSSGYYIYWTANEYRIFSSIAPISSGMNFDKIKDNYKDWEYLKTLPMKGYGEKGGPTTASGRSCSSVGTVDWSAKTSMCSVFEGLGKCSDCLNCEHFTYLPEVCHGEIGSYVFKIDNNNNNISDILEWMISQRK